VPGWHIAESLVPRFSITLWRLIFFAGRVSLNALVNADWSVILSRKEYLGSNEDSSEL
jgi:hypothetical protein